MQYTATYQSPMGELLLAADETGLTGLWFDEGKYFAGGLDPEHEKKELPVFEMAKRWLDIYFDGKEPDFTPAMHLIGSPFRLSIWERLLEIPYGKTVTYGELAKMVAEERGVERMAAQAVGGAVGHNPISIIVPCHRVIGANGSLTGYGGGLDKKEQLLALEGMGMSKWKEIV